jgi:hypothetical protein
MSLRIRRLWAHKNAFREFTMTDIIIRPVVTKADKRAFIDLPFRLYANDPNWVPPLKSDVMATITPGKNPWFEHGEAQLFLAEKDGKVVGRISAHLDFLALKQPPEQGMGPASAIGDFLRRKMKPSGNC